MARATVTIRELKNKETGIDLSVTSYKETKGMLGSTYEYQLMVVSNLSYLKTPKHKETDNVQFTVMKKLTDFEEMHHKFNTKYSGTAFPQLPKKVLMMNDGIAKERRNTLDQFMRFLACTPKLCTDPVLLDFLGVSAMKAGKLKKIEVSESIVNKGDKSSEQKDQIDIEGEVTSDSKDVNLFDDDEDDANKDDDDDLFAAEDVPVDSKVDLKLFNEPDLSGALAEGEGQDLFIAGSRSETKVTTADQSKDDEETTDDLFSVDDDLDKIMKMKINSKENRSTEPVKSFEEDISDLVKTETIDEEESVTKQKPTPRVKPPVPKRRDIAKSDETEQKTSANEFDSVQVETEKLADSSCKDNKKPKPPLKKKPEIGSKPVLKPKPGLKPKPEQVSISKPTGQETDTTEEISVAETITEDDIMKYIQENTQGSSDDLDLFS